MVCARTGQMWLVTCPQCRHKFLHSEIQPAVIERAKLDPFRLVPKPVIPPDGDRLACPQCKTESVFQRFHLFYDSER